MQTKTHFSKEDTHNCSILTKAYLAYNRLKVVEKIMYKTCYFKELSTLNYSCKQIMQGTWLKHSKKHWCVCVFLF